MAIIKFAIKYVQTNRIRMKKIDGNINPLASNARYNENRIIYLKISLNHCKLFYTNSQPWKLEKV